MLPCIKIVIFYKYMVNSDTKRVVVIGGGTGTYTVLTALRDYKSLHLSAIVSMCDDGGDTGKLRDQYGVLPPGDVRRCLVALSGGNNILSKLFEKRLFKGHSLGNLVLASLEKSYGDFESAIKVTSNLLRVRGEVIPVTLDNVRLYAELEGGYTINGETNIDIPKHNPDLKIESIFTKPEARVNQKAKDAVSKADLILIGPGDLYTSILPNFITEGFSGAVEAAQAKKVYICNLMTKHGETTGFYAEDFVNEVANYVTPDYILLNTTIPSADRLSKYKEEGSGMVVRRNKEDWPGLIKADLITEDGLLRHDYGKLANNIVYRILYETG